MEQIKDTLASLMRALESKNSNILSPFPEEWLRKALTKREFGHIKFKYFKQGVLGVSVDSSAWLYALNLKKEDLLVRLQKENSAIKSLSLRIGDIN